MGALPRVARQVPTGQVWVSSPELTALDLADRPQRGGGVSNVATVLAELAADPGLSAGGLVELAVRFPAASVGFAVDTRISANPKVYLRADAGDGGRFRVKVEVNTHERSPARPLLGAPITVTSSWWSGTAQVRTFTTPELVATKIRALYQRKKGRDLFDLWLALTELRSRPGRRSCHRPAALSAVTCLVTCKCCRAGTSRPRRLGRRAAPAGDRSATMVTTSRRPWT